MTSLNIFNRSYTSYTSNGSEVWLINGGGTTSSYESPFTGLSAGEDLIQGDFVYASGNNFAVRATALSGVDSAFYNPIGIVTEAVSAGSTVSINLDGIAVIGSGNITADTQLVPGTDYFLSKYKGQITSYSTASGTISISGSNEYGASVRIGRALSTSELEVEIQPAVILSS